MHRAHYLGIKTQCSGLSPHVSVMTLLHIRTYRTSVCLPRAHGCYNPMFHNPLVLSGMHTDNWHLVLWRSYFTLALFTYRHQSTFFFSTSLLCLLFWMMHGCSHLRGRTFYCILAELMMPFSSIPKRRVALFVNVASFKTRETLCFIL